MNQIQLFNGTEFGEVRTVVNQNNEPMICLVDILQVLGSGRTNDVVNKLREDEYEKIVVIDNLGRPQNVLFVKESGFYKVVLRSNSPKADKFTDWVTSEVLPSLRKNGGYIVGQENLTPEQIIANALVVANNVIDNMKKELQAAKPAIEFYDIIGNMAGTISIGEFSKYIYAKNGIKIGQNNLFKLLRKLGYLISTKGSKYNTPQNPYLQQGLFVCVERTYKVNDETKTKPQPRITGKGQVKLKDVIVELYENGKLYEILNHPE